MICFIDRRGEIERGCRRKREGEEVKRDRGKGGGGGRERGREEREGWREGEEGYIEGRMRGERGGNREGRRDRVARLLRLFCMNHKIVCIQITRTC